MALVRNGAGANIDTRTLVRGNIFFALPGTQTDGHQFVKKAFEKGASAAVVSRPDFLYDDRCVLAEDVLKMLQDLASWYRDYLNPVVMAVTGSNGKTTNKNLLNAVLQKRYKIHSTAGNFNNHIGVPLTILNAPAGTEFLLVEMGTNHFGEIADLCRIAKPDFGSILNIGKSHLEFLGSEEGVLKAKSELAEFLIGRGGLLFLNEEEMSLQPLMDHAVRKVIFNREHLPGEEEVKIEAVREVPFVQLKIFSSGIRVQTLSSVLWGGHNLRNLIHAIGVGLYFKVPVSEIVSALQDYVPKDNRSQVIENEGFEIFLDAYNANPTSMRLAVEGFATVFPEGAVVLGDMGELGESSAREHRSILSLIRSYPFKRKILVGPLFRAAGRGVDEFEFYEDVHALKHIFDQIQNDSEIPAVLIKGSRSMELERLL